MNWMRKFGLTTFITPWRRFRYRRTPMGHCSAGDAYTRRFDDDIQGIMRKYKCVNDTLLYNSSIEEVFWHTYEFLTTCAAKGITLKPEKFQFAWREVDFVGFRLGWDGYKPTDERFAAIKNFSMPDKPSISDIRSWYGFVNQLAPFLATAPIMNDFRELLKKPRGRSVCIRTNNCKKSFAKPRTPYASLPRTAWHTMTRHAQR